MTTALESDPAMLRSEPGDADSRSPAPEEPQPHPPVIDASTPDRGLGIRDERQIAEDAATLRRLYRQRPGDIDRAVGVHRLLSGLAQLIGRMHGRAASITSGVHAGSLHDTQHYAGELQSDLPQIAYYQDQLRQSLAPLMTLPQVYPAGEYVSILRAINTQFGGYRLRPIGADNGRYVLEVRTEPITLYDQQCGEDVEFGPFTLEVHLPESADGTHEIAAVAEEANPCPGAEDVVHPHVNGEELCLGEERAMVQGQVRRGDLDEALCVIDRVLHTYNDRSPFAPLERWTEPLVCDGCGHSCSNEDDLSDVDGHDGRYCDECTRWSSYHDRLLMRDEAVYCEGHGSYIDQEDAFACHGDWLPLDDLHPDIASNASQEELRCERCHERMLDELREEEEEELRREQEEAEEAEGTPPAQEAPSHDQAPTVNADA